MTVFTLVLSIMILVVALYTFRLLNTPHLNAFCFAVAGASDALTWYGAMDHPNEGYDPMVNAK